MTTESIWSRCPQCGAMEYDWDASRAINDAALAWRSIESAPKDIAVELGRWTENRWDWLTHGAWDVARGCGELGCITAWGPWCFECNVERLDRIGAKFDKVADALGMKQ